MLKILVDEWYELDGEIVKWKKSGVGATPRGGMIFTEIGYDIHFGEHPTLIGSWIDQDEYTKGLYKHSLSVLKSKGHKTILRTRRVNESMYKTVLRGL